MRQSNLTYKAFKELKHTELRVKDTVLAVTQLQSDLGYKCPRTSIYLRDTIEKLQRNTNIAFKTLNIFDENTLIYRDGIEVKAKTDGKIYALFKLEKDYLLYTFDAMLNCKK